MLVESIYHSNLKSGFQSNLMNTNLAGFDNNLENEIEDDDCEVKIMDVNDFLFDLKQEKFNYIDAEEFKKRNTQSRIKPNINRSQLGYSTTLLGNSGSNSFREGSKLSALLANGGFRRSKINNSNQ